MKRLLSLLLACCGIVQNTHSAPANDNFANAENLTGELVIRSGDRSSSTFEIGEPVGPSGDSIGGTVWYKWTAPAYGQAEFGVLVADVTNIHPFWLQLFVGTELDKLTPLKQNNNSNSTELRASALIGKNQTYYIQLGSNDQTKPDAFSLFVILRTTNFDQNEFQTTSYTNDNFSQAVELTGSKLKAISYPFNASREEGEPTNFSKTLWWKWMAPTSGITIFSTIGGDIESAIIVGQGDTLTNFAYSKKEPVYKSGAELTLKTTANQIYYITISPRNYAYQSILSLVHLTSAPDNSGYGTGGRFTTLSGDVMNGATISGVFSAKGITRLKVNKPVGFYIQGPIFDPKSKKWSFHINNPNPYPARATIVVEGIINGKTVAKITKNFKVW